MSLTILTGSANIPLATAIAETVGMELGQRQIARTPDGELRIEIQENIRARDVFLVQPTCPPLDQNLMELLFMADACRRAGANHVTAIIPYFGYARQDRSVSGRQALGARLVPDLLRMAGVGRVVAVDLHTMAVEAGFGIALEHLSAADLLCKALGPAPADSVVLAADMAALGMAERYAHALGLPTAIIAKVRISDQEVVARNLIGDVRGKRPIIVDDMIITGATIEAALNRAVAAGAVAEATVVASHGLFVEPAPGRLKSLPIRRMLVTDSVELPPARKPSVTSGKLEVVSLAPLLAQVISRLHAGEALTDLVGRT